jgi:hypothetical protein
VTAWYRGLLGLTLVGTLNVVAPPAAKADVVLDWNVIAVNTAIASGQNPFFQARTGAIVQLAVFEAVNAITGEYEPYLGTIAAAEGASAEAAAIAAAHTALRALFAANATTVATLDAARVTSLAAIPDGPAETDGIAVGEAAANAMLALRARDGALLNADGSTPAAFYVPGPPASGVWQPTPSCPINPATGLARGVLFQWQHVTPFGVANAADFIPGPPPAMTSNAWRKDFNEVKAMGSLNSTQRPQDRTDVARFYAPTSPTQAFSSAVRQIATSRGDSLTDNARVLALMNMAVNDALIASFATKYRYLLWRPEHAIRGDDGNPRTDADPEFLPFILTPCFPSYPSNHASGTGAAAEVLRRAYGAGGHDITLTTPSLPTIVLHYTTFNQIVDDVDDARVYGGIHYRFDQDAGNRIAREVATEVYKNNLRPAHGQ